MVPTTTILQRQNTYEPSKLQTNNYQTTTTTATVNRPKTGGGAGLNRQNSRTIGKTMSNGNLINTSSEQQPQLPFDNETNATTTTNATGLSEYTLNRILKWLDDVEACHHLMKPPSQLAWSGQQHSNKLSRTVAAGQQSTVAGGGGGKEENDGGEYCLSDYDSFDDQLLEYNRVVDKTFHIVHDD